MEFFTNLPKTIVGYDTIWLVVDRLTKSTHFIPIKETNNVEKLTKAYLRKIVRLNGVPLSIISDKDSRVMSHPQTKDGGNVWRWLTSCIVS